MPGAPRACCPPAPALNWLGLLYVLPLPCCAYPAVHHSLSLHHPTQSECETQCRASSSQDDPIDTIKMKSWQGGCCCGSYSTPPPQQIRLDTTAARGTVAVPLLASDCENKIVIRHWKAAAQVSRSFSQHGMPSPSLSYPKQCVCRMFSLSACSKTVVAVHCHLHC